MKSKLMLVAILISSVCCAQSKDTLATFTSGGYEVWDYFGNDSINISINKTGIRITGDTLKAIRLMNEQIKESNKLTYEENKRLYYLNEAAIDFVNHIPDYWKKPENNPYWTPYYKLLRAQGYKLIKIKK